MPSFTLNEDVHTLIGTLVEPDANGHLKFGWSGQSIQPADPNDLIEGRVRFRDYIMEGFLAYGVRVEVLTVGSRLTVDGEGSIRDWSIRHQVRHYIKAAGLTIVAEDEVTDEEMGSWLRKRGRG